MIKYVTSAEIGPSPAAVDMQTGVIEINRDLWQNFTSYEKKFIIEHERGHYFLQTDSELEADLYALKKLYKTEKRSLKKAVATLANIGLIPDQRVKQIYIEALKIDSQQNKNKKAAQEIMRIKQTQGDDIFISRIEKNPIITETPNADPTQPTQPETGNSEVTLKRGFIIGNYFVSFETVSLIIISYLLFKISKSL